MHSSKGKSGGPGELALLRQIRSRARLGTTPVLRMGIGDDCALLRLGPDEEAAITTDLSIAGRHFQLDWHAPEVVGHRVLARGLSDIAAMGARPVAAFLSLGLPGELTVARGGGRAWIERFYDGFLALADAYKTPLAGGDLAQSPVALADIVVVGAVPRGRALLRSGARPGDSLYVTGALGGAAAGLARLGELAATGRRRPPLIRRSLQPLLAAHLYPQPRIAQGLRLQQRGWATAALDVSDGLSTDLTHLCEESNVAAEVEQAALPIHAAATLAQALHGGEDYELLFTAASVNRLPRAIAGVPVTRIGRIVRRTRTGPAITLLTPDGPQPLRPHGWEHFA